MPEQSLFATADAIRAMDQPGSAWNTIASRARQQDPFCGTPAWQLSFHEVYGPKRRLLIRHSNDSLIAFAEQRLSENDVYLTPIESHWLFGNNLMGPNAVALLKEALVDLERHYTARFPPIVISALPQRSATVVSIRKHFSDRFRLYKHDADIQCAASLSGGLDGYLSRRSSNHRRKLIKQSRRARERGITFVRHSPTSQAEVDAVYDRMIAVELTSWKGIEQCGMAQPREKKFYHAMLRRLADSESARVMFACCEGKDIGFIFGGMVGTIYRGQQFSYDDSWRDASLGNLLQLAQIEWLCEAGATRYDMGPLLGDRMEYKSHWTEKRLHIQSWLMWRK